MVSAEGTPERFILDRLRESYEREGYAFFVYPSRELVPPFLDSYRPDAIALKGKGGVVIEVRGRAAPKQLRLSELAKLFIDQRDWKLEVVGAETLNRDYDIRAYSRDRIEAELDGVDRLARHGHSRAAVVIGWGALEAAVRALRSGSSETSDTPLSPSQIPEWLARNGLISQEGALLLRRLSDLRNAIAHGDVGAEVDNDDISSLTRVTRELLEHLHQPA